MNPCQHSRIPGTSAHMTCRVVSGAYRNRFPSKAEDPHWWDQQSVIWSIAIQSHSPILSNIQEKHKGGGEPKMFSEVAGANTGTIG